MSADPQRLLSDFKAGKLVNPFEFLICGLRAAHVDLARTAHRRKALVAASSDGMVRGPLLKGLADSLKALEAAGARKRPPITDQQRDEDCRQVVAALYRIEQDCGTGHTPRLPYKVLVKILSEHLEISGKRVRQALRLTADVQPALFGPSLAVYEGVRSIDCDGCAAVAADPSDVCLRHNHGWREFQAHTEWPLSTPQPDPEPRQKAAGKVGYVGWKQWRARRGPWKVDTLGWSPAERAFPGPTAYANRPALRAKKDTRGIWALKRI